LPPRSKPSGTLTGPLTTRGARNRYECAGGRRARGGLMGRRARVPW
jgi:hypothetical protein